jgi:hypothetical protein
MKRPECERKAGLAYHEAGHAVTARALGLEVTSVTILPDLDLDTAGLCCREWVTYFAEYADLATRLSAIEKDAVVTLAGPIAECQYLLEDFNAVTMMHKAVGWASDLETARRLVALAVELKHDGLDIEMWSEECDELFGQLSVETEIMVSQNWSAIECIAKGLLDFSVLNGADVDDLIAGAEAVSLERAWLAAPCDDPND